MNPLPVWARILAAALIFGGYAALEWHDAQVEALIAQQATQAVASAGQ
jgi:hypothetical protein